MNPGNLLISVTGQKRGSVTLPCQFEAKKISDISLNSLSKNIPVCETEECSGRVFKQGNCDIIIKDLSFSDAGMYILYVYYHNDQAELERQIRTYQLHIHGKVKTDQTINKCFLILIISAWDKLNIQIIGHKQAFQ